MYYEQRSNMLNFSSINQLRSQTPCALHVTNIQYDMDILDLDIEMVNVSIRLSQYCTVGRLIGNIRVSVI